MDYLGEAADRAATGYAMLRDPAQWEKIASGFMERQALREGSREFLEMMKNTTAGSMGWDPAGLFNEKGRSRPSFSTAGTSSQDGILTSEEIRDKKLELRELTEITIPDLTEKLKLARLSGLRGDIEAASISLEKATNKANDLSKAVGSASASAATFNTMFASSLQAGGVGPDWGGFSDLADMTREELEEIAKGGLGKSKAIAERAQMYLDLMKKGSISTEGKTDKKSVSIAGQSTIDTNTIGKELDKQGAAYTTLNGKIVKGWGDLEGQGLVHYTAMSELSRIRTQAELEYMAEAVNFGGTHPIVQNKIIMGINGPDWTPPAFTALTAPSLKAADFSGVKIVGGGQKPAAPERAAGSTVNITVNQTNNGVKTDAEGMNKSLGKIAALGGGLP
jgi:hypothetical protein